MRRTIRSATSSAGVLAVQEHPDDVSRDTAFVREPLHVEHVVAASPVPDEGADNGPGSRRAPGRVSPAGLLCRTDCTSLRTLGRCRARPVRAGRHSNSLTRLEQLTCLAGDCRITTRRADRVRLAAGMGEPACAQTRSHGVFRLRWCAITGCAVAARADYRRRRPRRTRRSRSAGRAAARVGGIDGRCPDSKRSLDSRPTGRANRSR